MKIQNQDSTEAVEKGQRSKTTYARHDTTFDNYNKIMKHKRPSNSKKGAGQKQQIQKVQQIGLSQQSSDSSSYSLSDEDMNTNTGKNKKIQKISESDIQRPNSQKGQKSPAIFRRSSTVPKQIHEQAKEAALSSTDISEKKSGLFNNLISGFGWKAKSQKKNSATDVRRELMPRDNEQDVQQSHDYGVVDPGATGGTRIKDSSVKDIDSEKVSKVTQGNNDEIISELESTTKLKKRKTKSNVDLINPQSVKQRKAYLIYPDNQRKDHWDILITLLLLFSCVVIPYRIGFGLEDDTWHKVMVTIDCFFFVDIIVNFLTVVYDDELQENDELKTIAKNYVLGWFFVDVLAIFPFELLLHSTDVNGLIRFARIGRLYKLVKLLRLIRVFKILKKRNRFLQLLNNTLNFGSGFDRLFFFISIFFILCHTLACLFVILAQLHDEDLKNTWMEAYNDGDYTAGDLYAISFYWTITTITTVGYGDISATNTPERWFCSAIMVVGVISFSIANSSLGIILNQVDQKNTALQEKIAVLDKIRKKFNLPQDLYTKCKRNLQFAQQSEYEELQKFLKDLPHKLNVQISLYIYEERYKRIRFFQTKSSSFLSWICPLLHQQIFDENQYIYNEEDDISQVYFLLKGKACFVLPSFQNVDYIVVGVGDQFGIIDIFGSSIVKNFEFDQWILRKDLLQRQFTVMAKEKSEVLCLNILDLNRMRKEFFDCYDELFKDSSDRLRRSWRLKLRAIKSCRKQIRQADLEANVLDNKDQNALSDTTNEDENLKLGLKKGRTLINLKYEGAKDLHQIDEQSLEDDESDSSLSESESSSFMLSQNSSSKISLDESNLKSKEDCPDSDDEIKDPSKNSNISQQDINTPERKVENNDGDESTPTKSPQGQNDNLSIIVPNKIQNLNRKTPLQQQNKDKLQAQNKIGRGLDVFKKNVSHIMAEQSVVRLFNPKKQDGSGPFPGIQETTAENIINKSKKEKKSKETRAQGKNILSTLGNALKNQASSQERRNAFSITNSQQAMQMFQNQTGVNPFASPNQGQVNLLQQSFSQGTSYGQGLSSLHDIVNLSAQKHFQQILGFDSPEQKNKMNNDGLQSIIIEAQNFLTETKNNDRGGALTDIKQRLPPVRRDAPVLRYQTSQSERKLITSDSLLPSDNQIDSFFRDHRADLTNLSALQNMKMDDSKKVSILLHSVLLMQQKQDKQTQMMEKLLQQNQEMFDLLKQNNNNNNQNIQNHEGNALKNEDAAINEVDQLLQIKNQISVSQKDQNEYGRNTSLPVPRNSSFKDRKMSASPGPLKQID